VPPRRAPGDSYESRYGSPPARVVEEDYATYRPPNLFGREDARGSSSIRQDLVPSAAYDTYRPPARRGPPPRAPAAPPRENDYSAYDTYRPPSKPSAEYARNMERFAGVRVATAPAGRPSTRHHRSAHATDTDSAGEDDSDEERSQRRRDAHKKKKGKAVTKRSGKTSSKTSRKQKDEDSESSESDSDSESSSDESASSDESDAPRRKSKPKSKSKLKAKSAGSGKSKVARPEGAKKRSKSGKKNHASSSGSSSSSPSSSSSDEEGGSAVMGVLSKSVVPVQTNVDALGAQAFGSDMSTFPDLIGDAPAADFSNMPGEDPVPSQSNAGSLAGRFPQLGGGSSQQAMVPMGGMNAMGVVGIGGMEMNGMGMNGMGTNGMGMNGMGMNGMGMNGMGMNGMGMNGMGMNQHLGMMNGLNVNAMGGMMYNPVGGMGFAGKPDNMTSDFSNMSMERGRPAQLMFPGNTANRGI
jgi:hypothetical protein